MKQYRWADARKALDEALSLRRAVAKEDTYNRQTSALVSTLNTLGLLLSAQRRVEEARQVFNEALEISHHMAAVYCPDIFLHFAADAQIGLGKLSIEQHQVDKARKAFDATFAIGQDLERQKDKSGRGYQATALYYLGRLDLAQGGPAKRATSMKSPSGSGLSWRPMTLMPTQTWPTCSTPWGLWTGYKTGRRRLVDC
jgi:tetratricopeptide (TPR) repeat protein